MNLSEGLEPTPVIRVRRFSGFFWPIFDSFCGGNILLVDMTPAKRIEKRLKRTRKSTEPDHRGRFC